MGKCFRHNRSNSNLLTPLVHRRAQEVLQRLGTRSADGICPGLHRDWNPKKFWGKFQMSKECSDNCQELMVGMIYWENKNGIEIDIAVFFINLEIQETVKNKFNPGVLVEMYESAESGILPLMVIPRTTQEIEEYIWWEEAASGYQVTRTQS